MSVLTGILIALVSALFVSGMSGDGGESAPDDDGGDDLDPSEPGLTPSERAHRIIQRVKRKRKSGTTASESAHKLIQRVKAKRILREAADRGKRSNLLPSTTKLGTTTVAPGGDRKEGKTSRIPSGTRTLEPGEVRKAALPAFSVPIRQVVKTPKTPSGMSTADRKAKRARFKAREDAAAERAARKLKRLREARMRAESAPKQEGATEAAESLYTYVTRTNTNARSWGTKLQPNAFILARQRAMGGLTPDGIYGPATRARGKVLTGKTFPARV